MHLKGGLLKLALKLLAAFIIALTLGAGSALLYVRAGGLGGGLGGGIAAGPWETSTLIGSSDADPYTRARVAVAGILALNRDETVYYTASRDDAGDTLRAGCTYTVTGSDPPARWWSITLYGADNYLVANPQDRYSYGGNTVARGADGGFVITVGPAETDGNWIPSGGQTNDTFSLTLRLYNPAEAVARDPAGVSLPHIAKEACSS